MRALPDLAVYLVTDPALCASAGVEATTRAAAAGGATLVQLRDKAARDDDLAALARRLKAALAPFRVPLVVNDRVAPALAAEADGVHIGQGDGDPAGVRTLIGPDRLLGLSVENTGQLAGVDPAVVDYVGAGPVVATPTKPDAAPPVGFGGLAAICRGSPVPVVAIGGIGLAEIPAAVRAGARGVAVVSAICGTPDPQAAAAALRRAVEAARAALAEVPS